MKNFYFTYGMNHLDNDHKSLGNYYTVIQAAREDLARQLMHEARGLGWAFCYPESEKQQAITRWDLKERPIESVKLEVIE